MNYQSIKLRNAIVAVLALTAFGTLGFAAVQLANIPTTLDVNEPLSVGTQSLAFAGYPNEEHCLPVSVTNAATSEQNARLSWSESSNPDGVLYGVNLPHDEPIAPQSTENVDVCMSISSDSPVGSVSGTVTVERV